MVIIRDVYLFSREHVHKSSETFVNMQDKNETSENFSLRLLETMQRKGYNQQQLGDYANLSRGAVSKYVRGLALPKSMELYRISKVLGVSMEWLLDGIERKDIESPERIAYWEREATSLRVKLDFATDALLGIVEKMKHK